MDYRERRHVEGNALTLFRVLSGNAGDSSVLDFYGRFGFHWVGPMNQKHGSIKSRTRTSKSFFLKLRRDCLSQNPFTCARHPHPSSGLHSTSGIESSERHTFIGHTKCTVRSFRVARWKNSAEILVEQVVRRKRTHCIQLPPRHWNRIWQYGLCTKPYWNADIHPFSRRSFEAVVSLTLVLVHGDRQCPGAAAGAPSHSRYSSTANCRYPPRLHLFVRTA